MKISSLTIKNYRAIKDITINLNEHMNVIYGVNGVGKTSILSAINELVECSKNKTKHRVTIINDNIPNLKDPVFLQVKFNSDEYLAIKTKSKDSFDVEGTCKNKELEYYITLSNFIPRNILPKITAYQQKDNLEFKITSLPLIAYIRGINNYDELKNKFEELENLENQRIRDNSDYRHPTLEKVRSSIKNIADYFEEITIDRERQGSPLCVKKYGKLLNIDTQLSSGEASVITLIGKITFDLLQSEEEENVRKGEKKKNHVVIIDEIDMSLHPQWQMKIGKILKNVFPDVQFIITSHSPFIWAGLNKEEIIWLDFNENHKVIQKPVDFAKGGSVESIIAKFFDTKAYDEDFSKELHEIENAIDRKEPNVYKRLEDLEEVYGKLPIIDQLRFKMRMLGL